MNDAFRTPQRVLILGAGSDIAAEFALQLAEAGTNEFVLGARSTDRLLTLDRQLTTAGASLSELVVFDALVKGLRTLRSGARRRYRPPGRTR